MSRTMGSLNAPGRPDVPMRMLGCTRRTTSASPMPPSDSSSGHLATSSAGRAYRRCGSPRPGVALVSRPARSTAQNRARAAPSDSPSACIAAESWSAMPVPAVPAPKITIRWSGRLIPVALAAASTAAKLTAPVPWMSWLNESRRARYQAGAPPTCQAGRAERGVDQLRLVHGQVHAPGPAVLVAVVLDRLPDGRGVDDGEHLGQVVAQQPVVQDLVAVVHLVQQHVPGQIGGLPLVLRVDPGHLAVQRYVT